MPTGITRKRPQPFRQLVRIDPRTARVSHILDGSIEGGDGCRAAWIEDASPNRGQVAGQNTISTAGAAAVTNYVPALRRSGHPIDGVPCIEVSGSGPNVSGGVFYANAAMPLLRKAFFAVGIKVLTAYSSGVSILTWRANAGGNPLFDFYQPSNVNARFRNDNGQINNVASGTDIRGAWATLMGWWDGTTVRAYVNSTTPFATWAAVGPTAFDQVRFPESGASAQASTILYSLFQAWEGDPTPADIERILRETQASYSASVFSADPIPAVAASAPTIESEYRSTAAGGLKLSGSTVTSGNVDRFVQAGGSNPVDLTLPGGATNPTAETFNGSTVLQFGASGTPRLSAALPGGTRSISDFSLYFLIRYTATTPCNLFTLGNNDSVELSMPSDVNRSFARFGNVGQSAGGNGILGQHFARDTSRFYCVSFSIDGTTRSGRMFVDNAEAGPYDLSVHTAAQILAASSFSQYGYQIGYNGASPLGCGFQLGYFGFGLGGHTHYQHRQWVNQMRADFPNLVPALSQNLLIITGSSNPITNLDTGNSLPELFLGLTTRSVRVLNLCLGSTHTHNARARIPYTVYRAAEGVTGRVVVAHYAGGNDPTLLGDSIAAGTSANTQIAMTNYWTDIAAYLTRAGVSYRRVAFPQLSRTGIDNLSATYRPNLTTWQGTQVGTLFDTLCGWDADVAYNQNGYLVGADFPDGTHHSVALNTRLAPYWVSAIDPLMV